jgi:hypothetical protein
LAKSDLIVTDIQKAPVEYQLTYLDSGHLPRGNDVSAARIRFLLRSISATTGDSADQIADRTSRSTTVLREQYGKAITNLRFLEEANRYLESGAPKTNYNDLSTLQIILLGK